MSDSDQPVAMLFFGCSIPEWNYGDVPWEDPMDCTMYFDSLVGDVSYDVQIIPIKIGGNLHYFVITGNSKYQSINGEPMGLPPELPSSSEWHHAIRRVANKLGIKIQDPQWILISGFTP